MAVWPKIPLPLDQTFVWGSKILIEEGKMKLLSKIILGIFCLNQVAFAEAISLAKAAELACHRIERLVTLKKIEENFLNRFYSLEAQALPQEEASDPAFKILVAQFPGLEGNSNKIELLMDLNGKTLSHKVIPGPQSEGFPIWPDKDPVTLSENSLHYVLEGWVTNPALIPFFKGLKSLRLTQVKDSQGKILARSEMHSSEMNEVLEVFVGTDGNFHSSNIFIP